jgi:hypothetical protein
VAPPLPAGLTLNTQSGVISGTPTAVAAMANYTVTASNSAGSTSAVVAIAVNPAAPAISYGAQSFTLTTNTPVALTPTNTGGAATSWSISPALPAGLLFDTSSGVIGGVPSAVAAPASYTITAQNTTGQSLVTITVSVGAVLVDLGHSIDVTSVLVTSTRVATVDQNAYWVLWNYATGQEISRGQASCTVKGCPGDHHADALAGSTFVYENGDALTAISAVDGSALGSILISSSAPVSWWTLASDGSYIATGNTSGLTVWSPAGSSLFTRAGDYSKAVAFAATGAVQVAGGPAGQNVIETIAVPSGTSAVSPTFQGTFYSWFLDGARFLSASGSTVFVYSSTGQQQDIKALSSSISAPNMVVGQGPWFWTAPGTNGPQLNIYKVGASAAPAASYPTPVGVAPSGLAIGGASSVIDLSGATPVKTDYTLPPLAGAGSFGATTGAQWVVGGGFGVVLDGASLSGTPRYFGYGAPLSIAGSDTLAAISTGTGRILYYDVSSGQLQGTINFPSSQLALSADGTVLVAGPYQSLTDRSIRIYSLPSGSLTYTWSYSSPSVATVAIAFAASGAVLAQQLDTCVAMVCTYSAMATAPTGGAPIWSVNPSSGMQISISPDGTLIALPSSKDPSAGTAIYKNGALVTSVNGWGVGWVDNNTLLTNSYTFQNHIPGPVYAGAMLYSASGTLLSMPPLPELLGLQIANGTDLIYDQSRNVIFSATSGAAVWTSQSPLTAPGSPKLGAVTHSFVVFASGGGQIRAEPY